VRDIRSKHLGRFISVPGLVRRATDVRPKLEEAMFECERCHAVVQQPQTVKSLQEPVECYKDHGGCGRSSSSTRFKLLEDRSEVVDFQRLEVQEPPERSKTGTSPQRLNGQVYDDLTGLIWPGSRVTMNGILKAAPRNVRCGTPSVRRYTGTMRPVCAVPESSRPSRRSNSGFSSVAWPRKAFTAPAMAFRYLW